MFEILSNDIPISLAFEYWNIEGSAEDIGVFRLYENTFGLDICLAQSVLT
jgi:hypothetical protein